MFGPFRNESAEGDGGRERLCKKDDYENTYITRSILHIIIAKFVNTHVANEVVHGGKTERNSGS